MTDIENIEKLLKKKQKVVAMLAPSFVVQFDYPQVVGQIKKLGFTKVVELTFGAKMTNINYQKVIKSDKSKTWIASPCPTIVQVIRNNYPHLVENLIPVHSPMGSMAQICKKFYPDYKIVFIGPCITKKIEAKDIGIEAAITFKELEELFICHEITAKRLSKKTFEKFYNDYTKIYPIAGGLSQTLHYKNILTEKQVLTEDRLDKVLKILNGFKDGKYKNYLFLDVLSCAGGCIGGPGISSPLSLKERADKVTKYRDYARNSERDLGRQGKIVHVKGVDFTRSY